MRRARVDANQPEIVDAFRKMGAYVFHVHTIPNGCDVIICYLGVTVAVEIKDGSRPPSERKLTEGEEKFMIGWTGVGGKWAKVESIEDAKGLIESIREHS